MDNVMREKVFIRIIVALMALSAFIFTGCDKASESPVLGGFFNNYWTSDNGQVVRIMGYAEGHQPGSQAVFQIQFDNPLQNASTWSDNYRVVLVDPATGNEWEIDQGKFDVQAWTADQFPVTVQFSPEVEGWLRLNVLIDSGGGLGVQLTVGGWENNLPPTLIES